jgi:hypothetical protein
MDPEMVRCVAKWSFYVAILLAFGFWFALKQANGKGIGNEAAVAIIVGLCMTVALIVFNLSALLYLMVAP